MYILVAMSSLLSLIGIAWFNLWGCAPTMSVPPARPLSHQSPGDRARELNREFGMGSNLIFLPSYTSNIVAEGDASGGDPPAPQNVSEMDFAQLYYRKATADGGEWGGSAQLFILQTMPGAGAYRRFKLIDAGNFWAGGQIEGGFLYAGVRAPISLAFANRAWLTTAPSASLQTGGLIGRVPAGLSLRVHKSIFLDSEVGMRWVVWDTDGGSAMEYGGTYVGLNIGYGYAR